MANDDAEPTSIDPPVDPSLPDLKALHELATAGCSLWGATVHDVAATLRLDRIPAPLAGWQFPILVGMPIHADPSLPAGVVELRRGATVLRRFIPREANTVLVVDLEALDRFTIDPEARSYLGLDARFSVFGDTDLGPLDRSPWAEDVRATARALKHLSRPWRPTIAGIAGSVD